MILILQTSARKDDFGAVDDKGEGEGVDGKVDGGSRCRQRWLDREVGAAGAVSVSW